MGKQDTPTQALTKIEYELLMIVNSEALKLMSDLVDTSPVDTGHFKSSWSIARNGKWSWSIRNRASYANVLSIGRVFDGGQMRGSLQMPNGIAPLLQKTSKNIEARSKKVRE